MNLTEMARTCIRGGVAIATLAALTHSGAWGGIPQAPGARTGAISMISTFRCSGRIFLKAAGGAKGSIVTVEPISSASHANHRLARGTNVIAVNKPLPVVISVSDDTGVKRGAFISSGGIHTLKAVCLTSISQ